MDALSQAKNIFSKHGWLSHVPVALQAHILNCGIIKTIKAGESLFRVDDPPGGASGIINGLLAIHINQPGNGQYMVALAGPGEWIGIGPMIANIPQMVTAEAKVDTNVILLRQRVIEKIAKDEPIIWRFLAMELLDNLNQAFRAYDEILIPDAYRRVCAILMRLAERHDRGQPMLKIPISQKELAEITRLSRSGLNLTLSRLSEAEVVRTSYGVIEILDFSKLETALSE
jgi:CRP/FNR family cyclic AMP-dependent transcriptional regulator